MRLFDIADDLQCDNYTLEHLKERINIYSEENFIRVKTVRLMATAKDLMLQKYEVLKTRTGTELVGMTRDIGDVIEITLL